MFYTYEESQSVVFDAFELFLIQSKELQKHFEDV